MKTTIPFTIITMASAILVLSPLGSAAQQKNAAKQPTRTKQAARPPVIQNDIETISANQFCNYCAVQLKTNSESAPQPPQLQQRLMPRQPQQRGNLQQGLMPRQPQQRGNLQRGLMPRQPQQRGNLQQSQMRRSQLQPGLQLRSPQQWGNLSQRQPQRRNMQSNQQIGPRPTRPNAGSPFCRCNNSPNCFRN